MPSLVRRVAWDTTSCPVVILLVRTISVGRLDEQVIGVRDRSGIGQHRTAVAPQVAAEQNRAAIDPHPHVLVAFGFLNTKPRPITSSRKSISAPFRYR